MMTGKLLALNNPKESREIIIRVGAAGGRLTIYGQRRSSEWEYIFEIQDNTPQLIDEPAIHNVLKGGTTWRSALMSLDRYTWPLLNPLVVHPEFATRVWRARQRRLIGSARSDFNRDRWLELCKFEVESS